MAITLIFHPDFHAERKNLEELREKRSRLLSISNHTKAIISFCDFKQFSLFLIVTKKIKKNLKVDALFSAVYEPSRKSSTRF